MAPVPLEPERELLVVHGLVCERRHLNAEHFGAHLRALESAVQVGPDHAVAAEAVGRPVLERGEWLRGSAASAAVTPTWISYPPNVTPPAVVARTARVCFSRVSVVVEGISPRPAADSRSDSIPVGSSSRRPSIWNPPQMPITRAPEPCRSRIQSARPTRAEPVQIRNRVLAARQDDEVVLGRRTGPRSSPPR